MFEKILRETPIRDVRFLSCTTSTNDYAKELLADPARCDSLELPLLVSAEAQTAARGRGSKKWWTGPGAIAVSLLLRLSDHGLVREDLTLLSPLTAKAVAATLEERLAQAGLQRSFSIKLPNDVYLEGKKICGILIESPIPEYAVIGIGINTNNTLRDLPDEFRETPITTLVDAIGFVSENDDILVRFFKRFFAILAGPLAKSDS